MQTKIVAPQFNHGSDRILQRELQHVYWDEKTLKNLNQNEAELVAKREARNMSELGGRTSPLMNDKGSVITMDDLSPSKRASQTSLPLNIETEELKAGKGKGKRRIQTDESQLSTNRIIDIMKNKTTPKYKTPNKKAQRISSNNGSYDFTVTYKPNGQQV